jgi:predicted Fe-Mo cluster-binding NifX family protein
MKIAVTYENGQVFQHFGHTAQFKLYTVEDGKVLSSEVVDTNGSGHGALAGFLESLGVNALICGGIGGGARFALQDADIEIYGGVSGDADEAVEAFLSGVLEFNPNPQCNHHGSHHDHSCGDDHHCGGHCH